LAAQRERRITIEIKRPIWIGVGLVLLVVGGVLGVRFASGDHGDASSDETGAAAAAAEEEPADQAPADVESAGPMASAIDFETLEGPHASLRDYAGQVVVLNFWGTWCVPCRYEIPELAELQRVYGERGAVVIGVAIDSGEPADIMAFAEEYGINYPIWISTMATAMTEFGAVGYPYTLLVDQQGRIRGQYLGPQTFSALAAKLNALLAGA
jgi:thiol-disulfide isomerase/thioredoxin